MILFIFYFDLFSFLLCSYLHGCVCVCVCGCLYVDMCGCMCVRMYVHVYVMRVGWRSAKGITRGVGRCVDSSPIQIESVKK